MLGWLRDKCARLKDVCYDRYIKKLEADILVNSKTFWKHENAKKKYYTLPNKPDNAPPPPPPMPTPSAPPSPQQLKRSQSQSSLLSTKSNNDKVQEELNGVLHYIRKREGHKNIIIKQTPESYISQKSNPKEVQEWLQKKAFDKSIRDKFKGVAGYQMFDMKKPELERICGKDEGCRLYSQLLVMKSVTDNRLIFHQLNENMHCIVSLKTVKKKVIHSTALSSADNSKMFCVPVCPEL
nr:unnamed protein product [Callosobruchus chinensis]